MTDEALEQAITEVGRETVFSTASAMGWSSGDAVPKYVWWEIVNSLRIAQRQPEAAS